MAPDRMDRKERYVAVIDQDKVTDEVRDIAVKYDPLNRSGRGEGFYVDDDGELHIDDEDVMEEHKLIEKKVPNDAVQILRLPAARGRLVHQYGANGFRLYEMPAPTEGNVVGLLGRNGVGKSTALKILSGVLRPNLGEPDAAEWDALIDAFRGSALQTYLERLQEEDILAAYKPQQVDAIPEREDGTVDELLAGRDARGVRDEVVEALALDAVRDRALGDLSGGELQRVAVAATAVKDADVYLFDEPSSYLDIAQRLRVADLLRELSDLGHVVVVEHDLATLDVMADTVHVLYGEPGGFGVVAQPLSVRSGINQFLEGRLREENVQIRADALDFLGRSERRVTGDPVLSFPALEKAFDTFALSVEAGTLHEEEVLGVLGRNGLGKTVFVKLLAGALEPDSGDIDAAVDVSYKPQYMETGYEGAVEGLLASEADIYTQAFKTRIKQPLGLGELYDRQVQALSGGELQRVGIALALGREADVYLLDEPSAYLDVQARMELADVLRSYATKTGASVLVVDHDLMLLDYVTDRTMVFAGTPGVEGRGHAPEAAAQGLNRFLADIGITFRRDPDTGRPRANKPGSQKDKAQQEEGEFFATA